MSRQHPPRKGSKPHSTACDWANFGLLRPHSGRAIAGFGRGCLIVVVILVALAAFQPHSSWIENSRLSPYFLAGAHTVSFVVPRDLQQLILNGTSSRSNTTRPIGSSRTRARRQNKEWFLQGTASEEYTLKRELRHGLITQMHSAPASLLHRRPFVNGQKRYILEVLAPAQRQPVQGCRRSSACTAIPEPHPRRTNRHEHRTDPQRDAPSSRQRAAARPKHCKRPLARRFV